MTRRRVNPECVEFSDNRVRRPDLLTILVCMNGINKDIDPASELREEDEESSLPELELEGAPARSPPAARRSHAPPSSRPRRPASIA